MLDQSLQSSSLAEQHRSKQTPKASVPPSTTSSTAAAAAAVSTTSASPPRKSHHSTDVVVIAKVNGDSFAPPPMDSILAHQELARSYLPRLFSSDVSLVKLDLTNTNCGDVALVALTDAIKQNKYLQQLLLDHNRITDQGAFLIAEALLVTSSSFTELSLNANEITDQGAAALIQAMEANPHLNRLDVQQNPCISDEHQKELEILIRLNSKTPSFKETILSIKRGSAVAELNISRADVAYREYRDLHHDTKEHLDDWCAETLGRYLAHDRNVTSLDLSWHHISDEGARYLSDMLRKNRYLDKINLQGNSITAVGAQYFVDALLESNNSLRYICLMKNLMSHAHIIKVEWAVVLNRQPMSLKPLLPKLERNDPEVREVVLDVSDAQRYFDDVTCRLVADALKNNTFVTKLRLSHSNITAVGARFLADWLAASGPGAASTPLQELDLSCNPKLGDGSVYLAQALALHPTLTTVRLNNTNMTDDAARSFAEAIETNQVLTFLDLSENPLIKRSGKHIVAALNKNSTLRDILLDGTNVSYDVQADVAERKRLRSEPIQVQQALHDLYNSKTVKAIHASGKNAGHEKITDSAMRLIAEAVEANTTAAHLDLSHNSITTKGLMYLLNALCENKTTTTYLDLSYNPLANGAEVGRSVARLLQYHQTLRYLDLSGTGMDDAFAEKVSYVMDVEEAFPIEQIRLDDSPLMSVSLKFHLLLLVRLNALPPRFRENMRYLWKRWRLFELEKVPFKQTVLDFSKTCAMDSDAVNGQQRQKLCMEAVCAVLEVVEGVTHLNFSGNGAKDDAVEVLVHCLINQHARAKRERPRAPQENVHLYSPFIGSALVTIDLSNNQLTDESLNTLTMATEQCPNLHHVELSGNPLLSPSAVRLLQRTLLYNSQPENVQALLVRVSKNDPTLLHFDISKEEGLLNDDRVALLCDALQRNTRIVSIDVSHSHITWKGLSQLLQLVLQLVEDGSMRLQALRLRNTMINKEDTSELTPLLCEFIDRHSPDLRCIDISCNEIDPDVLYPAVVERLRLNKHLTQFGAADCGLRPSQQKELHTVLSMNENSSTSTRDVMAIVRTPNPAVTSFSACDGEINSATASEIFRFLEAPDLVQRDPTLSRPPTPSIHAAYNPFITKIQLSSNNLSGSCLAQCFASLGRNRTLVDVDLSKNFFTTESFDALVAMLKINKTLLRLDLSDCDGLTVAMLESLRDLILNLNDTIIDVLVTIPPVVSVPLVTTEATPSRRESTTSTSSAAADQRSFVSSLVNKVKDARGEVEYSAVQQSHLDLVRFFRDDLKMNLQLSLKRVIPRIQHNDPSVTHFSALSDAPPPHAELPPASAAMSVSCTSLSPSRPPSTRSTGAGGRRQHSDCGVERLSFALQHNQHLTSLDLSRGLITDRGVRALAKALYVNRSVTSLDLSFNQFGDEGLLALADTLQVNHVLVSLDVCGNERVTSLSLERLQTTLTENDTLGRLRLLAPARRSSASAGLQSITSPGLKSDQSGAQQCDSPTLSSSMRSVGTFSTGERRSHHSSHNNPNHQQHVTWSSKLDFLTTLNHCHAGLKQFLRTTDDQMITHLDLSNAKQHQRLVDDVACGILCEVLRTHRFMVSLNLSGNDIEVEGARTLASILVENHSLRTLILSNNRVGDGAVALLDALKVNHFLIKLDLQGNDCSPLTLDKIQLLLQLNLEPLAFKEEILQIQQRDDTHTACVVRGTADHVHSVRKPTSKFAVTSHAASSLPRTTSSDPYQRKEKLDDDSIEILSAVLRADVIIRSLDLSYNDITDCGFHSLLLLLKRNKGITSVAVAGNRLTDDSIVKLTELMPLLVGLKEIDFRDCHFTAASTSLIVNTLRTYVSVLDIAVNRLPQFDLDLIQFFATLNQYDNEEFRSWLIRIIDNDPKCLVVDMNSFYSYGHWKARVSMKLLAFALLNNTIVEELHLEFNDIDDGQFLILCNALHINRSIRVVNVSSNLISSIAPFVEHNGFQIRELSLRSNQLGLDAMKDLSSLLKRCDTLETLDVSRNLWGRQGASLLREALLLNGGIKQLEMDGDDIPIALVQACQYAITLDYRAEKMK